ncbi:MAG: peptidoglycan bridge formation glycyltransferase FemA/FemB family protein [Patescibacteria group bacterium]
MRIVVLTDKERFNNFIGSQKISQFLQSWQWGEFQTMVGGKIIRLGIESETGELLAATTLVKKSLPMGKSYFFCPRGPIIDQLLITKHQLRIENILQSLFNEIKKLAKNEKVIFLRFEPLCKQQTTNNKQQIIKTLDVEPSKTLILDLSKSESELLKDMSQKTRYNIKLAEKKTVELVAADINYFEDFWQLISRTSERDKFRLHGRNYYRQMIETDKDVIKLFFAKYKKRLIATGIFSFFGNTAVYLHGASANFDRNVMAPFFLHWQCIKLAKSLGCNFYDFNGIDEIKWPGVTRFKKGFGGNEINYQGTFDLVFNPGWYSIYKMVRNVRRTF